jgi:hypothetical protein
MTAGTAVARWTPPASACRFGRDVGHWWRDGPSREDGVGAMQPLVAPGPDHDVRSASGVVATGAMGARRRIAVSHGPLLVGTAAVAAALVAGWAVSACALGDCPSGRTCVPAAGVSFVLPAGWHTTDAEDPTLFAAERKGGGAPARLDVADGSHMLAEAGLDPQPATLDDLEAAALRRLTPPGGTFSWAANATSARVTLPLGPAVRLSYTQTTSFMFTYTTGTVEEWVRVGDRPVVFVYREAFGEGSGGPAPDLPEFVAIRGSLQTLAP